jgi:predicted ferric reductase
MRYKKRLFWFVVILLAIIPVLLLIINSSGKFSDYDSASHTLGQIAGLIGMTLFAITFILPTRMKFIEDAFGGLDKVYRVHSIIGGTALILILFHPLLLVFKFIPESVNLAARYLLPSIYWSVNFGIIALVGMILLICFTLYTRMKYNKWKFSHRFLGIVFMLAVLHIFLVRGTISQDDIFNGYYIYVAIVSIIGLSGFIYSTLFRDRIASHALYKIKSLNKLGENIYEIILSPSVNKALNYKAGQFVFVRFNNKKLGEEPHPFSIASTSNNPLLKIIIKGLGDFTTRLSDLNVGDEVNVEGPYGRFNYEKGGEEQIWVAGGIGITPFIGMSEEIANNPQLGKKVELYYTVKCPKDLIYLNKFKELESRSNNFRVIPWISDEKGFIRLENIGSMSKNLSNKEFFICGPQTLKDCITNDLINLGISKDKIHQEEFGFK